jgi:precorrin-6B methylase 2
VILTTLFGDGTGSISLVGAIVDPAGSVTDLEWKANSNHERWETAIELARAGNLRHKLR